MRKRSSIALACLALTTPRLAAADEPARPADPSAHGKAARTHDGFYLRLGAGPGFTSGSASTSGVSATMKGMHVGTELAIGTTVAPGLVVGGGEFSMVVFGPKYEVSGQKSDAGTHHVGGVGPFVDYYLDPTKGLHFQGALVLSGTRVDGKSGREGAFGVGFGALAGAGWETWVGDQWSLGGLLRIGYYRVGVKGDDSDVKTTLSMLSPTVLITGTFH